MASFPSTVTLSPPTSLPPHHHHHLPSSSSSSAFFSTAPALRLRSPLSCAGRWAPARGLAARALSLDFSRSFFEKYEDQDDGDTPSGPTAADAAAVLEEKEAPQCPPGLRQYETMVVIRPDMSEEERLAFTGKYEELLVAGGGMYVEIFNRGVIPLAYVIKTKNKDGETNTYFDGIYLLFTYFTKPESIASLESKLVTDFDVIRFSNFKIRKRKYDML